MPQKKHKRSPGSELRHKAEEHLRACKRKGAAHSPNVAEMERLIHELEVHQIELEMQNEELKQARAETEAGLDRYTDLYDFAPVGYFTLSRDGIIIQVNLTGTRLLGVERSQMVNRRFGLFIAAESRLVFNALLEKVFASEANASCVASLWARKNPIWVSIEATATEDRQECRAVVTDITERKRAEIALQESEERYRTLFAHLTEGFALGEPIWDTDGTAHDFRFLEINDSFTRLTGLTRDILGRSMTEVLPQLERDWIDNYCNTALSGMPRQFDSFNRDTQRHYAVVCYSPSKGRFATLFSDITEKKRIEREREGTIEFLHLIGKADSTKELIRTALVFFKRLSGCEAVDLRLKDGEAISHHESLAVLPLRVSGGQIGLLYLMDNRKEMFTPKQVAFWESLADSLAVALAKVDAEEKVRENERRFKLLSETADRLLRAEDTHQKIEELCRELMGFLDCQAFFNFLVDEDAGMLRLNAYAGIPEEDAKKIELLNYGEDVCGSVARDRSQIIIEDILNNPDPRASLIRSFGIQAYAYHPLVVSSGNLIGTLSFGTRTRTHFSLYEIHIMKTVTDQLAMAMDRTELIHALQRSRDHLELRVKERTAELKVANESTRRYAGKLEERNKDLEDFLFIAAHHLQEPLRKIMTFSDRLNGSKESLDSISMNSVDRIQSSVSRMRGLIHDLTEYSRIMEAKHLKTVDLNQVMKDILCGIDTFVRETGATVRIENLPAVEADVKMVCNLFKHLLVNALKFRSGRPPEIKISGKVRNGREGDEILTIFIEDNGIGFEEKYLDRIFTPFQKLHRQEDFEGNGIGLAICKRVVGILGGSITAKSRPGEGSVFIVNLPCKTGAYPDPTVPATTRSAGGVH